MFSVVLLVLVLQNFGNCEPWKFADIHNVQVKISNDHPFSYDLDEETGTWYDCSCSKSENLFLGAVFTEQDGLCCKFRVHLSNVEAIGKILAKFSSLQQIYFDYNIYDFQYSQLIDEHLKLEPEVIQNKHNVTKLTIAGFNITTDFFKNFVNLKEIELQRCVIRKGQNPVQGENLNTIGIFFTILDGSGDVFGELPALNKLKINFSPNLEVTGKLFENMENLVYLDLQALDNLTTISGDAFNNLVNLHELNIMVNPGLDIRLEKGTFKNLSKLNYLYLKNSYKLELTGEEFEGLIHLKELDISYSEFKSLDADKILEFLPELKILSLRNFFSMDSPEAVKTAQVVKRLKQKRPDMKIIL